MGRAFTAALVAISALIAPGCGSVLSGHDSHGATSTAAVSGAPRGFATGPAGARAVAVIRAWSDALRRGDVHAAALYFQIPSLFFDGGPVVELHSVQDAEQANEELSCGARLLSASRHGQYVDALFLLTNRPGPGGGGCGSGTGQTARTFFLIQNGRIVEWLRVPDVSGGNGAPAPPQVPTAPTTPQTPQSPAPTPTPTPTPVV